MTALMVMTLTHNKYVAPRSGMIIKGSILSPEKSIFPEGTYSSEAILGTANHCSAKYRFLKCVGC